MTNPQIERVLESADNLMANNPVIFQYEKLSELEKKSGFNKVYFIGAFAVVILSAVFLVGGAKLVTDLISFLYPAYASLKALDTDGEAVRDPQWTTYWIVFTFISIIEPVLSWIVPFYYVIKVAFFGWMCHPKFQGASFIHTHAIDPLVMRHLKSSAKEEVIAKKAE
eukprot:CAMPEP_0171323924 /NCGR_PEP_ID=MMETSP0816-20121228/115877_1 /TAXON_ID=420281 /ORGANISM="Proboscia inermis, Strain CCAP1064/1" /LENGTH=166 /DNA_ID=CAMNT_0011822751 /DNA_START=408 /DNA_END=908 /DNA_ORIENTATION=-